MVRLLLFLFAVTAAAFALTWFGAEPATVTLAWPGNEREVGIYVAIAGVVYLFAVLSLIWSGVRYLLTRPRAFSRFMEHRSEEQGLDALSGGLIAVGAGDRDRALEYAEQAQKRLPKQPLTRLLSAQAAQLDGDRAAARRIFEDMVSTPRTELFGLRGLYLEARREGELEAARQYAERATRRNPELAWSVNALFDLHCRASNWQGALDTLAIARRYKHVDRDTAGRRSAVLLTALAMDAESNDIDKARDLALEAVKLAPGLVPAATLGSRLLVNQGNLSRAAKIIEKAWSLSPHPDLANAYAHLRPGDSPRDRLTRVRRLAQSVPDGAEGPIAIAFAAIDAHEWQQARDALDPFLKNGPAARVCALMARIESSDTNDQGKVREWLARAVRAPRDPAWTADGTVSDQWAPVSPVTGELDAFEWRVPVESIGPPVPDMLDEVAIAVESTGANIVAVDAIDAEADDADAVASGEAKTEEAAKSEATVPQPDPGAPGAQPQDEKAIAMTEAKPLVTVPLQEPADNVPEADEPAPAPAGHDDAKPSSGADGKADQSADAGKTMKAPPVPDAPQGGEGDESTVFVPRRAPDDPGPDARDAEEEAEAERKYTAPPA